MGSSTDPLFAQDSPSAPKLPNRDYPLTIDGTATMVGKWACGGDAKVEVTPGSSADLLPGFVGGLQKVAVTASVPAIDCGDSTMNKYLRKALKEEEYPEITYQALKFILVDHGAAVQTSGELTVAGVTKAISIGAKLIPLPGGATKIVGKLEVNMKEYGVKPPSIFFGALKVSDVVTVQFNTVVMLPRELTLALFANMNKIQEPVASR